MKLKRLYFQLDAIKEKAIKLPLKKTDKWVVFSDLHMGDHSYKDDFKRNTELFTYVLEDYYQKEFGLILNGDVEELQRFQYTTIRNAHPAVFNIFLQFHQKNKLLKTIGNHDVEFSYNEEINQELPAAEAFLLEHKKGEIFIFHGHQASDFYIRYNKLVGWLLKYIATPLGFNNYSVAHHSKKKYKIEKDVYHYSAFQGIVSIIGHTHRPLFESLSKAERVKILIENLVREYVLEKKEKRLKEIKKIIKSYRKDLRKIYRKQKNMDMQNVYGSKLNIPCLFNSGTVIGKRGITCLEIENNNIKLVHWFDKNTSGKYLNKRGYEPEKIGEKNVFKMVLNEESLDYIFAKIKLLR